MDKKKRPLCKFGFHRWVHWCEVLKTVSGKEIIIGWKQCGECAKSKLTLVLR